MERFSPGDNVLFRQRHPRSFEGSENSRFGNSDMDFSDVFGGPPRRYSMQEMKMKHSFSGEALESEDESALLPRDNRAPWPVLNEKPVFGEESVRSRRRYTSDDFFDDIFKADESYSSPRRTDRDPFGSAPGSRTLSPARPLPPKAEPFATSLPAQFSLPAKLTTAMDSPGSATSTFSSEKNKDGVSNGISNQQNSRPSFSNFLNRAINGKGEARGDRHSYRQSPLSREVFLTPNEIKSDEKDKGSKFRKESENVGSPKEENQFHFSIYKWAGGGLPFMLSLRAGKSSEVLQKSKLERISSSNGRIESSKLDNGRSRSDNTDTEPPSRHKSVSSDNAEPESSKVESEKDDKQINQDETQTDSSVKDTNSNILEPKSLNDINKAAVFGKATLKSRNKVQSASDQVERDDDKLGKEVSGNVAQASSSRPEMKPLSELLSDKSEAQGRSNEENESVVTGTRNANSVHVSNKDKKNDTGRKISKKISANKDSAPGYPITSGNTPAKSGVKGKVKEFVKIFNNETIGKSKVKVDTRSQGSRFTSTDKYGVDSEGSSTQNTSEKAQPSRVDNVADAFSKVEEFLKKESVKQSSEDPNKESVKSSNLKTRNHKSSRHTDQEDASFYESSRRTSKVTSRSTEDIFQGSFSVEELSQDQEKALQTSEDSEEIRASTAKIQQWSNGRKGNIRSLLSTLQLVLWPGSGWKPVPLVDIIEASAVKRAYQRALLCLHPDKLQQKDASAHQKYIAEKVFDVLQEAWDHFNSLGGI